MQEYDNDPGNDVKIQSAWPTNKKWTQQNITIKQAIKKAK